MSSSSSFNGAFNPFNMMEEDTNKKKQEDDKKVERINTTLSLHGVTVCFQGGVMKRFVRRAFAFLNKKTHL